MVDSSPKNSSEFKKFKLILITQLLIFVLILRYSSTILGNFSDRVQLIIIFIMLFLFILSSIIIGIVINKRKNSEISNLKKENELENLQYSIPAFPEDKMPIIKTFFVANLIIVIFSIVLMLASSMKFDFTLLIVMILIIITLEFFGFFIVYNFSYRYAKRFLNGNVLEVYTSHFRVLQNDAPEKFSRYQHYSLKFIKFEDISEIEINSEQIIFRTNGDYEKVVVSLSVTVDDKFMKQLEAYFESLNLYTRIGYN